MNGVALGPARGAAPPRDRYKRVALYDAPVECFRGVVMVASGRTALVRSQSAGDEAMNSPSPTSATPTPGLGRE